MVDLVVAMFISSSSFLVKTESRVVALHVGYAIFRWTCWQNAFLWWSWRAFAKELRRRTTQLHQIGAGFANPVWYGA
jgi:hypothetical protein